MAFNSRTPNDVATHVRKYTSIAQLVSKSKAGAVGIVSGVLYVRTSSGTAVAIATVNTSGQFLAADGTALLPAYAFASEATLGFWRSSAATVTLQGGLAATGAIIGGANLLGGATGFMGFNGRTVMAAPSNGQLNIVNAANTIGSQLKVDALPTIASGFGTSPSITAGSTPFAGSVNVGTGGVATSGIINFNGTAFPSAPFIVCMNTTTGAVVRATATATQLTITAPVAFTASDVITWICVSARA